MDNISLTNHSNSSTHTDCKYWGPESDVGKVAKRTAFVLVILLGIFGNVFVILLATKYTVRRSLNHLITNMAVSDTLFLFSSLLGNIPWLSNNIWRIYHNGLLGIIECKIVWFIWHTSVRVTLITLLVISIERFRATRQTLQKQRPYTLKQRMTVLAFSWLIPILFAIYFTYAEGSCSAPRGEAYFLVIWAHHIAVIILCCVIFALGILTTRRLSRPQPIHAHLNEQQRKERVRRTRAAVRMVLASAVLYTCCNLPFLIFSALWIVEVFFPSVDIMDDSACIDWRSIYFIISTLLMVVNSCFSPLIYIVFLPDFKEAAKKVLFRGRETQNQAPNGGNSIELQPAPNRGRTGQNLSQVVAS